MRQKNKRITDKIFYTVKSFFGNKLNLIAWKKMNVLRSYEWKKGRIWIFFKLFSKLKTTAFGMSQRPPKLTPFSRGFNRLCAGRLARVLAKRAAQYRRTTALVSNVSIIKRPPIPVTTVVQFVTQNAIAALSDDRKKCGLRILNLVGISESFFCQFYFEENVFFLIDTIVISDKRWVMNNW